jgi:hypothetical protein
VGAGEVVQIMYTHVSKCKNNKIKFNNKIKLTNIINKLINKTKNLKACIYIYAGQDGNQRSCYAACVALSMKSTGLEFMILLPQRSECWEHWLYYHTQMPMVDLLMEGCNVMGSLKSNIIGL